MQDQEDAMRIPGTNGSTWPLLATGATIVAGVAVRKGMKRGWRRAAGRPAPDDPSAPDVNWGEALAWGVVSGTAVAIGRLVAKRAAAGAWEMGTGESPHRA